MLSEAEKVTFLSRLVPPKSEQNCGATSARLFCLIVNPGLVTTHHTTSGMSGMFRSNNWNAAVDVYSENVGGIKLLMHCLYDDKTIQLSNFFTKRCFSIGKKLYPPLETVKL